MANVQLLALSFFALSLPAFADWVQQPSGTNQNLSALHFLNADTGVLVGAGGTILKTTNGGQVWIPRVSRTTASLRSVHFSDARFGYAAGDKALLRTRDGGETWDSLPYPRPDSGRTNQTYGLNSVFAANPATVFAAGWSQYMVTATYTQYRGFLLKSADSGKTWAASSLDYSGDDLYFSSPTNGFSVGKATASNPGGNTGAGILRTGNGGSLWAASGPPFNTGIQQFGMYFADSAVGYVIGSSLNFSIHKTADGGATWVSSNVDSASGQPVLIAGSGRDHVWMMKANNGIVRTTDGGTTWAPAAQNLPAGLAAMSFVNANTGWAVGSNGLVLKTQSGGTGSVVGIRATERQSESLRLLSFDPNGLRYALPRVGQVRLTVYDRRGIGLMSASVMGQAGENRFDFTPLRLAAGVYFVRLESEGEIVTARLTRL